MGGKAKSGNDAMVNLQKQQAEEARQKEAQRQARLTQGLAGIKGAFEGAPVMGTRTGQFDWSQFKPPTTTQPNVNLATMMTGSAFNQPSTDTSVSGLPAGYKYVQIPGTPAAAAAAAPNARQSYVGGQGATQPGGSASSGVYGSGNSGGGYQQRGVPAKTGGGTTASTWGIVGPDGKVYHQGEALPFQQSYDTGQRSGGFGEDFYNKFRQGILDYYNPQVAQKYGEAKDELTYRLARAGTSRSFAATSEAAKLDEQNRLNRADVISKADTGAADLRTRVASERAKAEGQLYATENPDVGTNQALTAVRNISLDQPDVSPLGDIFKVALVGGANALSGYRNQKTLNSIPGYNAPGTRTV